MNSFRTLYYGLVGAARLLHFDASGAQIMQKGIRGFWSSLYWSMALVAPFFLLLILVRYDPAKFDGLRYLWVNITIYTLAWLSFPVVMERVSYFINRRDCYLNFIIAYNWVSCLYNIFYLLVGMAQATHMISWEAAAACSVVLMFAGLFWIGFTARKTLDLPISAVIGIVIIDMFLSLMISLLSTSLLAHSGIT